MPELPEVQTVVNYLSDNVLGKTISSIESPNNHAKTFVDGTLNDFYQILQQKEIHKIWRRGKYIIFDLDKGYLLFHLRMTGRLILQLPNSGDIKYVSAKLTFDDNSELFFKDVRKFGRVYFCNNLDWLEDKLGIEPLSKEFTSDYLFYHLQKKNRQIKPLLLDQSFIAGLGNIYVDEALWYAGIHPLSIASTISNKQSKKLHEGIQSVLLNAIAAKGTTIINFSYGDNDSGNYKEQLKIFGKENRPCPGCGNPIKKIKVAQRGTHFCPKCQLI
mgnify:CR=1 FL=1